MIDNEQIQEELEAEQTPEEEITMLETALLSALTLSVYGLYRSYGTDGILSMNTKRKRNFFQNVTSIVSDHYSRVRELVETHATTAYQTAFTRFMQAYENELDLPLLPPLEPLKPKEVFKTGYPLDKTMRHNRTVTLRQLRQTFAESFKRKETQEELTKRVEEAVKKDKSRVQMVVEEESARMQNEAQQQTFRETESQGIESRVFWNSMRDKKVRKAHQKLNGKQADENGWFYANGCRAKHPHGFEGPGAISLNIRCRCYLEILGAKVKDNKLWQELNSAESSSARRELWEKRRALAKERKKGDIS